MYSCRPHIYFTGSLRSLNLSVPKRCRYLKALLSSGGECEEEKEKKKEEKRRETGVESLEAENPKQRRKKACGNCKSICPRGRVFKMRRGLPNLKRKVVTARARKDKHIEF
ncbi:hypothetical protein TNIN_479671 [Trichonephila inaurata madagascariensis]|uniref:Uncharacterized protein n=1 Tax=Trichonephila inaurata madagascariensis TaxID=2747483 RepID=A0A8X6WXD4_9ARAC|nr:hypothetical protein TNIN_479671 [Trichonephila inaurata madagascariensis]